MPENAPGQKRVVVIGGGLSGLTVAHRLVERAKAMRNPIDVVLLEAKDRIGGAIWTNRGEGFILEGGADSFITNKPWGLELCRELELESQLIEPDPVHRRSFVVRQGKLIPIPEGFVLMAPNRIGPILTTPILSWRGKARMLLDLVLPRKDRTELEDESLAAFVKRRLGREALDRLVQPLVGGIYTADPQELSLRATLPQFLKMEEEHRSLMLAALRQARHTRASDRNVSGARYGLFVSFNQGMDTLPRSLAARLPDGTVRTSTSVRRVHQADPISPWKVELLNGPTIEANALVLATEAHASARLIDGFDPDLALQLRAIPYASSVVVNVAYRRDQVAHPLDGFGAVIPAIEGRSILAISFLSVKFPNRAPNGTVLLRIFVGGATQPDLYEYDDARIAQIVRQELGELLGTFGDPLFMQIGRHPRAMPQYTIGHIERVASIRERLARHPRLILTGNAFDGVGVPDCIRGGREAADAVLAALGDPAAIAAA